MEEIEVKKFFKFVFKHLAYAVFAATMLTACLYLACFVLAWILREIPVVVDTVNSWRTTIEAQAEEPLTVGVLQTVTEKEVVAVETESETGPEASQQPVATMEPEPEPAPEPIIEPEVYQEPEVTIEPEPAPESVVEPEPVEHESEPESAVNPDPDDSNEEVECVLLDSIDAIWEVSGGYYRRDSEAFLFTTYEWITADETVKLEVDGKVVPAGIAIAPGTPVRAILPDNG